MKNMQTQTDVAPATREQQSPIHHPRCPSRRRFPALALVALAAGLQLAAQTARAALLAYDNFSYTNAVGASINGLNGGVGWLGAYPAPGGTGIIVVTNGLIYTAGLSSGKAMWFAGGGSSTMGAGRGWGTNATAQLPNGSTYYYSMLVYPMPSNGKGTLNPFNSAGSGDGQNGFGVRIDNHGGSPQFKAWHPNQAGGNNLDFAGGYGKVYLVIGRVDILQSGLSTNRIWVYQDPAAMPSTEPVGGDSVTTAAWTINGANVNGADSLRTVLSGRCFSGNNGLVCDEVRIGTAFADVLLPSGYSAQLSVTPNPAVENEWLTLNWTLPTAFSTAVINPGNLDVAPLTSTLDGTGTTMLQAPGTNTAYILTFTVGSVTTSVTNQFTAIPPYFTINPASGWEGDALALNWRVPVGSTVVSISPDIGDVTGLTSGIDGTGTTPSVAPGSNATWVLSYTYNSSTLTLTQSFAVAAPYLQIASPVIEHSPLSVNWRIPAGFSAVSLEYGAAGGPFSAVDVTTNTVAATGAGAYTHSPAVSDTSYFLRYTNAGIGYVLSTNIVVYPEIFTNLVAVNNTKGVIINPSPMKDGVAAYSDRSHAWAAVPPILQGAQFVKFGQDDKLTAGLEVSFNAARDATFFLLIDNRIGDNVGGNNPAAGTDNPPTLGNGVMDWVLNSGFVDSGLDIGLDENPVTGTVTIDQSYSIYFRQVSAGETFTFYQQADGSQRNMYGVAGVAPQLVPIAFVANPDVITYPQTTTLQWTVAMGSTVSINNGIGDVTSLTGANGVGSMVITPPVGTNSYTLTYDPPGTATPPVALAPVTVIVNPHPPFNITYSLADGFMVIEWPAAQSGWILQSQTNTLGVGLHTNWMDVAGSESSTISVLPIDNSVPAGFFRLRSP